MDSTLAQLLQALTGNSAPNVMGNPGGIAGSRLAYMQGQNANANQLLNQQVFTGQQGINAMGGAQAAREAMAAPGGALNQPNSAPPISPMTIQPPTAQLPPMQPAPNPPGVMQQQLPQNVPMPGASAIPPTLQSQLQPQSQLQANTGKGGAIPPPPSQPQIQQQLNQQTQQPAQSPDQQISPQQAQDLQQTLQQNLQGMHAPQYKDIINAVKQAMPNATPMQRAMATSEIMKDVNSQTNEVLKQYAQMIGMARLGQGQERLANNEVRTQESLVKAGLSGSPDLEQKVLEMRAKEAQASASGNLSGKLNEARSAMSAAAQDALATARAYLPKDANALTTYIRNKGYGFSKDPKYGAFIAKNTIVAGEIARVQAGGKSPTKGAIEEIKQQLDSAGTQDNYDAIVDSNLGSGASMAKASQATTDRGGTLPEDEENSMVGSPPLKGNSVGITINAPAPPEIGTVKGGYRFKGGNPAKQENWQAVGVQ